AGGCGDRLGDLADELLARLVEADRRAFLVVRAVVDLQDVLHRRNEGGVGLRRDHPLLAEPGLQRGFFRAVRTVSAPMESTTASPTTWPASNRIVQDARPTGGAEQARAISLASAAPSSFRGRLGRSWGLRRTAASGPCSTDRLRTLSTVATSTSNASAIR